jgi:hypothetical protein
LIFTLNRVTTDELSPIPTCFLRVGLEILHNKVKVNLFLCLTN